jgi:hypothetical protein
MVKNMTNMRRKSIWIEHIRRPRMFEENEFKFNENELFHHNEHIKWKNNIFIFIFNLLKLI